MASSLVSGSDATTAPQHRSSNEGTLATIVSRLPVQSERRERGFNAREGRERPKGCAYLCKVEGIVGDGEGEGASGAGKGGELSRKSGEAIVVEKEDA